MRAGAETAPCISKPAALAARVLAEERGQLAPEYRGLCRGERQEVLARGFVEVREQQLPILMKPPGELFER